MESKIFAFTLNTKENLGESGCVFDNQGSIIGRILKKHPIFQDSYDENKYNGNYSYDIESLEETYMKITNGEIVLNIENYSVDSCSTWYYQK